MDKKRNIIAFSIWILTCLSGAIFMGCRFYSNSGDLGFAFFGFMFYLLLGCLFSVHIYFLLLWLLKKVEFKQLNIINRISLLALIAGCLTLLSFVPLYCLCIIVGPSRFMYDTLNIIVLLLPVYLISSIVLAVMLGEYYFRKIQKF